MATGPNRSGLRMIVPNSSFTRALNKPEKRCQNCRLPLWNARSQVRAPLPTNFFAVALNCCNCAYSEQVVISECNLYGIVTSEIKALCQYLKKVLWLPILLITMFMKGLQKNMQLI